MSGFGPNLLVLMYFLFGGRHALIEHMHMDDTHGDHGDHEWLPGRVPAAKSIKSPAEGVATFWSPHSACSISIVRGLSSTCSGPVRPCPHKLLVAGQRHHQGFNRTCTCKACTFSPAFNIRFRNRCGMDGLLVAGCRPGLTQ